MYFGKKQNTNYTFRSFCINFDISISKETFYLKKCIKRLSSFVISFQLITDSRKGILLFGFIIVMCGAWKQFHFHLVSSLSFQIPFYINILSMYCECNIFKIAVF